MPKSVILSCPSRVRSRLAGLRSRWTMRAVVCAYWSAEQSCTTRGDSSATVTQPWDCAVFQAARLDPFDVLHRNRRHRSILDEVIDPNDVGVRQLQTAAGFTLQLAYRLRVAPHRLRQEFQCHLAVELFVMRAPDHAHAAAPDHDRQQIAPEHPLVLRQGAHGRRIVRIDLVFASCPPGWIVLCHGHRRGNQFASGAQAWTGSRGSRIRLRPPRKACSRGSSPTGSEWSPAYSHLPGPRAWRDRTVPRAAAHRDRRRRRSPVRTRSMSRITLQSGWDDDRICHAICGSCRPARCQEDGDRSATPVVSAGSTRRPPGGSHASIETAPGWRRSAQAGFAGQGPAGPVTVRMAATRSSVGPVLTRQSIAPAARMAL